MKRHQELINLLRPRPEAVPDSAAKNEHETRQVAFLERAIRNASDGRRRVSRFRTLLLVVAAVTSTVAAAALGGAGYLTRTPDAAPSQSERSTEKSVTPLSPPSTSASVSPEPAASAAPEPAASVASQPSTTSQPSAMGQPSATTFVADSGREVPKGVASNDPASSLAEQNQLMAAALTESRAGRTSAALGALDRLDQRFPRSPFGQEAAVLRFRTLAQAGRGAEAAAAARLYLLRFPRGFARDEAERLGGTR